MPRFLHGSVAREVREDLLLVVYVGVATHVDHHPLDGTDRMRSTVGIDTTGTSARRSCGATNSRAGSCRLSPVQTTFRI
jgi:hypothetical protein